MGTMAVDPLLRAGAHQLNPLYFYFDPFSEIRRRFFPSSNQYTWDPIEVKKKK
jgi:hypothetical protein